MTDRSQRVIFAVNRKLGKEDPEGINLTAHSFLNEFHYMWFLARWVAGDKVLRRREYKRRTVMHMLFRAGVVFLIGYVGWLVVLGIIGAL